MAPGTPWVFPTWRTNEQNRTGQLPGRSSAPGLGEFGAFGCHSTHSHMKALYIVNEQLLGGGRRELTFSQRPAAFFFSTGVLASIESIPSADTWKVGQTEKRCFGVVWGPCMPYRPGMFGNMLDKRRNSRCCFRPIVEVHHPNFDFGGVFGRCSPSRGSSATA